MDSRSGRLSVDGLYASTCTLLVTDAVLHRHLDDGDDDVPEFHCRSGQPGTRAYIRKPIVARSRRRVALSRRSFKRSSHTATTFLEESFLATGECSPSEQSDITVGVHSDLYRNRPLSCQDPRESHNFAEHR